MDQDEYSMLICYASQIKHVIWSGDKVHNVCTEDTTKIQNTISVKTKLKLCFENTIL